MTPIDEPTAAVMKAAIRQTGQAPAGRSDSKAMMEAAMSNAELYDYLVELLVKVTSIVDVDKGA